jgi:hypothetical protein
MFLSLGMSEIDFWAIPVPFKRTGQDLKETLLPSLPVHHPQALCQ